VTDTGHCFSEGGNRVAFTRKTCIKEKIITVTPQIAINTQRVVLDFHATTSTPYSFYIKQYITIGYHSQKAARTPAQKHPPEYQGSRLTMTTFMQPTQNNG